MFRPIIRYQRRLFSSFRIIENPKNFKLNYDNSNEKFKNFKSLMVLCTPPQLNNVISELSNLNKSNKDLKILAACVDSINQNSDAISEVWFDKYFEINPKSIVLLEDRDDLNTPPRESDGVVPVRASKHWKAIESELKINLSDKYEIKLSLANTVFINSELTTMFYLLSEKENNNKLLENIQGQNLCELEVNLPIEFKDEINNIEYFDGLKKVNLVDKDNEDGLFITSFKGNLIKSINDKPASSFLENSEELMSSKASRVFFQLTSTDNSIKTKSATNNNKSIQDIHMKEKYEVIAGGGGWSIKGSYLALDPKCKDRLKLGSKVECFIEPKEKIANIRDSNEGNTVYETNEKLISIECSKSLEDLNYQSHNNGSNNNSKEIVRDGFLSFGSEKGFTFNGIGHTSHGETIVLKL
ncbi:hypothetical protein BVG19_g3785 [[Candida] boidinii]|nr:hypothetical protein BVG19_g3785 [[Candida] boidinii]OWB50504.1 hypothetical protein B5S27_g2054 [[Candida] boidinii]OWB66016.1 hypothetical protein B5S30_g1350 [[Candida] boidinii]